MPSSVIDMYIRSLNFHHSLISLLPVLFPFYKGTERFKNQSLGVQMQAWGWEARPSRPCLCGMQYAPTPHPAGSRGPHAAPEAALFPVQVCALLGTYLLVWVPTAASQLVMPCERMSHLQSSSKRGVFIIQFYFKDRQLHPFIPKRLKFKS